MGKETLINNKEREYLFDKRDEFIALMKVDKNEQRYFQSMHKMGCSIDIPLDHTENPFNILAPINQDSRFQILVERCENINQFWGRI